MSDCVCYVKPPNTTNAADVPEEAGYKRRQRAEGRVCVDGAFASAGSKVE